MNLQNSLRISKIETVLKSFTNSPKENYRKNQILEAVFKKKVKEWQQISALPQEIRNTLEKQLGKTTLSLKPSQIQVFKTRNFKVFFLNYFLNFLRNLDKQQKFYLNYKIKKK